MNAFSPKLHKSAMSKWGKSAHKRVAKSIGYALNQGSAWAWEGLVLVLMARLTEVERAALAYAVLKSLDDDTAYRTASVVVFGVLDGEVLQ